MKTTATSTNLDIGNDITYEDSSLERKIRLVTEGLSHQYSDRLYNKTQKENAMAIIDFILSMKTEINLSNHHIKNNIMALTLLSQFHKNEKSFKVMTRKDILSYLDRLRKPESADPLHKWIGSYNLYRALLVTFFKWLYYPDLESSKRPKPTVVDNIPQLKRKEQSIYKPSDLWTTEDDILFLKYCPNTRDKCYHMISRDTGCRPHEILKLRIKDVVFKTTTADEGNRQYAEVLVNGKTGSRHIPLINSIPYVKDWFDQHPQQGNPNAAMICGYGKSLGRRLSPMAITKLYERYKTGLFTKLLDSHSVSVEDKQKIKELLKKPWNPYIRRHSALTEKSGILKEHHLRQYAGWSPSSQMHLKYLHYLGNESSESLLEAYGIVTKDKQSLDVLRPKQCPNCSEPNKPDGKFCSKCRMVLTYDAYSETLESEKQKEDKLTIMEKQFNAMQSQIQSLISAFSNIKNQNDVDVMAKNLYGSGLIKEATTTTTAASSVSSAAETEAKEETAAKAITTTDLDHHHRYQQQKEEQLLIREAGKAAYHATITKSALSTNATTSVSAPTRRRRKMKTRITTNLPKKVS